MMSGSTFSYGIIYLCAPKSSEMLRPKLALSALILIISHLAIAGEGMWLPLLIQKMNHADMKQQGLNLTAEELYSINSSCIKDAVVGLGRPEWNASFNFCSGEIISGKGLFLTNHHCGYGAIQSLSTAENNYLRDGFWAMNSSEEKPAGFSVSILQRMDDVTGIILEGITPETKEEDRTKRVTARMDSLKKDAEKDSMITAVVKSFFKGNEYYIMLYKVYEDIRLVGAPASSIGKFGGDTDNWMWPRHTGDFSIFRIYADQNNNPAPYSDKNIPYKPAHFLPVSLKGVKKDDYAMIFGFPGTTDRFLTSYGVKLAIELDQPSRVKIRRKKLDIYEEGMARDEETRLKYAAKHSSVSNYWKYFIGQTEGLKRLHVYDKKKKEEEAFQAWVDADEGRKKIYGKVLSDYEKNYAELTKYKLVSNYITEAVYGVEILKYSRNFAPLEKILTDEPKNQDKIGSTVAGIRKGIKEYFKDYDAGIDRKMLAAMLEYYHEDLPETQQPQYVVDLVHKNKHNFKLIADMIFDKSIFVSEAKVYAFLENPSLKKLQADPAFKLVNSIRDKYNTEYVPLLTQITAALDISGRLYVDGLRKMNPGKSYYPDANSTMRISYGKVHDYYPRDAVYYNFITPLEGIMEKEDPKNEEFIVDERLKELYLKKDYGRYGQDGKLVVNFISSNDITGGNSGSPVINGNGELIGTAFDGNWEAMSGDIAFEPNLQRTISLDVRYTLFIIDKVAGAGYLLDEMKIVQ